MAGNTLDDLMAKYGGQSAGTSPGSTAAPGVREYAQQAVDSGAATPLDELMAKYGSDPKPGTITTLTDYGMQQARENTLARHRYGPVYTAQNPEDLSIAQRAIDRILGDRTQITGEKTDWRKLLKGIWYKGADQFSTGVANTLDFLAGDFAEELHVLGVESVNQAIEALNYIPGVDLDYVENKGNFLSRWANWLRKGQQQNQEYFAANANSSRAAQIVDKFGTSTVAAIPMALEALMLGPAAAAQGAGTTATTAGLQYTSSLAQSSGLSAMSQMGMQGMRNLMKDPQFWTSYLQVMGDGYQDALDQGMSDSDAALYGMVNGFFNAIIEIGGGDESLGGINRLPAQLREALESGNMGAVVSIAKSMFGEGWEEVQQGIMERGLMQAAQGDSVGEMFSLDPSDTRAAFNPFSATDEFAGGAVVGGLLGGGQSAITSGINRVAGRAAQQQEQTATQQQPMPTAQETGTQYVQQVITNMDVSEAEQQVLTDGLQTGNADPQTYAHGIQEAFRLGEMGLSYEQAVDNSTLGDQLNEAQFRHAWEIGARKAGHSTEAQNLSSTRPVNVPEYESIEEFSRDFKSPERVTEIFDSVPETDVNEFAAGFRAAYDMGQSGVSANYLTEANVPTLTTEQAQAAYQLGRQDAETLAVDRDLRTAQRQRTGGNQARVRGSVRGDGVSIADLKRTFNDSQNTAYRLLTRYADTTGVNIVLYNSQADANGIFPAAQGRFQWKDDTIYVDINSGLFSTNDVNGLGNYTMLRTFAHEFTHFIEKWNSSQYNEFREFVFQTMEARGQNVHDMIEAKQALDESGNMTYEQASREVVADAMMDILPDSTLVQQLANEHPNVFRTLLRKLREFAARMKQYYRGLTGRITEAETLKENGAYLEDIVQMWDNIAKGAVRNYQGANGDILVDQPAKPDNLPKRTSRVQENSKSNPSPVQPETRPASMDFFRDVEVNEEEAPNLARMAAQRNQPVTRERFPANDFTSQAEAGPDLKNMVPRTEKAPSEAQEAQAAEEEPQTPAAAETPAEEETGVPEAERERPAVTPEGEQLRNRLDASDSVDYNGFRYEIFGMRSMTVDIQNGGTSSGAEYRGTIRRVSTGGVPIADGRTLFERTFDNREEAVDYMVSVAESNNLLKEATDESTETTAAETPDVRTKKRNRRDGAGAVRVPAESQEEPVRGDVSGRQSDSVPPQDREGTGRDGDRADAERNGRSRSEGSGESRVQRGYEPDVTEQAGEQPAAPQPSEEEKQRQAEELHEEVQHDVEQKSTEAPGSSNYVIGDSLDLPNGDKARTRANIAAIRLVKQLEAEGRNATPEEQAVLSRYVGWGALSNVFDESKADWSKEREELKALLTDEEYRAASASTLNAHYTSIEVIKAMYEGLRRLGFKGGRMLEPSSGVGNFVGAMPADMTAKVRSWTMVELDNITGLIAKHLYPQNDVRIEGFETAIIPDGYMDVAIGNVPFGNYPVVDRAFPKKLTSAIHNYFFAKSLKKVRTGGIVMFITSSYTMNSKDVTVRNYIASQADLLGAIRLPNTAFKGNAGTEVVTDILILKKRAPGTLYAGEAFVQADDSNWRLGTRSEYFVNHPEMILGEETTTGSMYRRNEYTVNPKEDAGTLGEQITKAFENITGQMDYTAQESPERTNYKVQRAEKGTKQGSYVQKEGKIFQNDGGELKEVQTDEKTAKRISGMLGIRDAMQELMNAQQQGVDEKSIKALRSKLNKLYDNFVKEYGYLNNQANRKAFSDDPDQFRLFALETDYTVTGKGKTRTESAKKADIFSKNTVQANRTVTSAETVKDGLVVSRNTTGGVDVDLIARLTGKTAQEVTRELIETELAFKNREGELEPAEIYLSGNVRAKLRDAQALAVRDKDYQHNVDALKQIMPEDVPHEQIFVQPGTPWIPESVYSAFAEHVLGYRGVVVHRSNQTGNFTLDFTDRWSEKRIKGGYRNTQEWGTPDRSFLNLFEAVLNSRSVKVSYKGAEGKTIVDQVATAAANEKIEKITKEFQKWLWEDAERTAELEYLYNETYNNLVNPSYDGSTLTVNGLRAGWSLKPHQANAVQRVISSGGNTLLAHRVGAGKTMEMAAAAMKLRELGIIKKPMFIVPKSLVGQWGKEFSDYFPAAKLLVAGEDDFTTKNRKTFANRIATGDYDAVIVSYEQFEKIPISDAFAARLYQEQVDEIIQAINEAKAEAGEKSMSVKDMEKKRKQLEAKIARLTDVKQDKDNIEFEQLGIDSLFVDEAHNFKNLYVPTRMTNISGINSGREALRATDLYTKVRYLQQLNGGRGIVFATATPVMNSMTEMYVMQKYLQPKLLDQLGIGNFDAWAKQFGEVVNAMEVNPTGTGYRVKQSFSRFKNLNELQLLFRNFADVMTTVPGLKIPKMKGGTVKTIQCEMSEFQREYMEQLAERANNIKNVDPREDNALKMTSDGKKVSLSQRMIDPSLPYEENGKIYQCANYVAQEYKESKKIKGTQIIFLDMGTPRGKSNNAKAAAEEAAATPDEGAQVYEDLKARLVKLGIPAKEIAFIHDADSARDPQAARQRIFDEMNDGTIRVLIGSTSKMGVGMNAQKRVVAIHHLDAPWRPGDVEQRDGRAFRQKNINEEVSKYVYITKGSFDTRLWDILDRKSGFINQIMNGENVGRDAEDLGEVTLSAAQIKALASDNPLMLEQVELEAAIKKLENQYMAHQQSKAQARKKLQEAKQAKAEAEARAAGARKDIRHRTEASTDDKFSITVWKKTLTDKKEAGKALMVEATAKATEEGYTKIGTFAGFDVSVIKAKEGILGLMKADGSYKFSTYPDNTTLMITNMQKVLNGLDNYAKQHEDLAQQKAQEITAQEAMAAAEFQGQAELDQKRRRYNEVMEILNPKEEQAMTTDEDDGNVEYSLRVRQEFSSAATSRPQVAKLFKSKVVEFEDTNIDIGGGKYNYTTDYLMEEFGTTNMVYDPYNRGSEENLAVIDWLRAGNRADTATCANVLNVIKEQEARRNVILEVAKSIKEDGTAYFSTWEDNKANQEKGAAQTGEDSWQNRRKTADYVHEVEEFFNDVVRRGDVIIAREPKAELPAAFWRVTEEEEIEYSTRRAPGLSDREVLSMAADELGSDSLTTAERNALDIFRQRLDRLQSAQEQRAQLGRDYKEQQFTRGGSRAEADRIRSAMSVLDSKIKSLENSLLNLENKDVLKGVLQKARRVVELEERKRGDENLRRYRERRNESVATRKYRERVRREVDTLRKWLVSPSNKDVRKHVPAEIQKTVADFLESINLMSKTALATSGLEITKADEKYLKDMKKMRDAIKANVDTQGYSGYADLPEDFVDTFNDLISRTEQHIRDNSGLFVVNRMSAAELKQLSQTLKTLRKYIQTMNSFHNNAMFQHSYEAGEETIGHLTPFEKSRKSGTIYKFLRFDYMRPSYAFEHFGAGGKSIEHEFREGQAVQARLANRIIDFAKKTYKAREVKDWSRETKTFTLENGETVTMPVTHLMSLYCLNKRAQAQTHIYGDGIRVANYQEGGKVQLDEGHIVSLQDVAEMIKALTPRQMEVADALQRYMSTECAEWGNYVSLARFDVEQFGEENYFPINSDGRYLPATADESPDNSGLYALLNMGFTKELKENAKNRIILYNVFDVFANHTASMTQYRSFALPVLDALKWFNYKNETTSVRTKLSSAFGAPVDERAGSGSKGYAESFVLNLLRAYNGTSAQGDPYDTTMLKMLHRFNGAQIAYNLRVFIQQPTAIARAAMILSPAKLSKGLGMSIVQMRKLAEEMEAHSGIAAWKALGFYDTNISRGLTELIKQNPTVLDNVMEVGTKGAEHADRFTWAAMWYAAKDSVKRSSYSTEEEYFKAVTDLFEDVIYKTQVVDSLLTKSEFLRSKGGLARQLGSFMSEPSATMSMLADAHFRYTDDLQRGMSRSEAWRRNGGNIAKTAAVYAVGQVILAAMQAVVDAWRDDDEYDAENWLSNYLQKYVQAFKGNVIEELLPFGKVPIVSEIYEVIKGWMDYAGVFEKFGLDLYGNDISSGLSMYLKYIDKSMRIVIDKVTGETTNYTNYGVVYYLLRGASNLSGIPFGTAWRELQDLWNNTVGFFAPNMKLTTYERKIDRTYLDTVRPTGVSQKMFEKILNDANTDGNTSVSQDELGTELIAAMERGDITQQQAEAIWNSKKWKKTFETWRGGEKKTSSTGKTTTTTTTVTSVKATTTQAAGTAGYESFKKTAPLYGTEKKQAAYDVWETQLKPTGMSLNRFSQFLINADTDGNSSLKQDELGYALRTAISNKEIDHDQAAAIWSALGWSKSFDYWSSKHQ